MSDTLFSQHPVDRMIREIIATRRPVLEDEIAQIITRIATAPFDPQPAVRVPMKHRGLTYLGHTLGPRDSSLMYHLIKRVVDDGQWAIGTSAADYVADLREAARSQDAQVSLYKRRSGNMVAIVVPNRISRSRLGPEALPWLLVVFSADRGNIVSGYQISSVDSSSIPEDGLWLS